jgi:hypothetical protein
MTHLTTKQVLQMVDGTLDYASQAQCTGHLAVCQQCRNEIEFQKAVSRISRHLPVLNTSAGFAQRVMMRIVPQRQKSWKTKLIDNLGNIFAMCVVLATLGYAISNPSVFHASQESSQQSIVPQAVSDAYAKVLETFSRHASDATRQVVSSTGNDSAKMILLAIISLLTLVLIDQFVIKRFMGMKMKH